jgi:hypothetical protein
MNDVEDVWWCRTPMNSVVYRSGERRIRGQRRIALQRYRRSVARRKPDKNRFPLRDDSQIVKYKNDKCTEKVMESEIASNSIVCARCRSTWDQPEPFFVKSTDSFHDNARGDHSTQRRQLWLSFDR